jgi:hypothetical protein
MVPPSNESAPRLATSGARFVASRSCDQNIWTQIPSQLRSTFTNRNSDNSRFDQLVAIALDPTNSEDERECAERDLFVEFSTFRTSDGLPF